MQRKYNNEEKILVFLDALGVPRKKIEQIINNFASVYDVIKDFKNPLLKEILGDRIKQVDATSLDKRLENIEKYLKEKGVEFTTYKSEDFPSRLKEIKPTPMVIYYKGDLSLANEDIILGVVGTRRPTRYGRYVTKTFIKTLTDAGVISVSGLAYGIDSEVARTVVENNGKTIAVLGGGLNSIYPASNTNLAEEIVSKGGLIISEYWPQNKPSQYTFPERNRIISGLSKGVLVIEAGIGSGSLITATCAIEQGKDLFVVPGNIDSKESAGSNKLIEELPHTFTSSVDSILNNYGLGNEKKVKDCHQYTIEEKMVLDALDDEEKSFDELCEICVQDSKSLNILLTEMEISGIIRKLPGNYYGR